MANFSKIKTPYFIKNTDNYHNIYFTFFPLNEYYKTNCPLCQKPIVTKYLQKHLSSSVHNKNEKPHCGTHSNIDWNCNICRVLYKNSLKTQERKSCESCNIKFPINSQKRHESTLMHKILSARQNKVIQNEEAKRQDNSQQMIELSEKLHNLLDQIERNK